MVDRSVPESVSLILGRTERPGLTALQRALEVDFKCSSTQFQTVRAVLRSFPLADMIQHGLIVKLLYETIMRYKVFELSCLFIFKLHQLLFLEDE